jgi:hypothetical protein
MRPIPKQPYHDSGVVSRKEQTMNSKATSLVRAVVSVVLTIALTGCGPEQPGLSNTPTTVEAPDAQGQTVRTFVGTVDNSDAFIGAATDGKQVRFYLCNGTPEKPNTIAAWWSGEMSRDKVDLTSKSGARLSARLGSNGFVGSAQMPDGKELTFSAPDATGQAGVYVHETNLEGTDHTFFWIVQSDGQQRGTVLPPPVRCRGDAPQREGICRDNPLDTKTKSAEVEGLGIVGVEPLATKLVITP